MSTLPIIMAEWRKNAREIVRVTLDQYQGHQTIDVRTWWADDAGQVRPGKSGITLAIRHLPDLAAAVAKALTEAQARGLLDGGGR